MSAARKPWKEGERYRLATFSLYRADFDRLETLWRSSQRDGQRHVSKSEIIRTLIAKEWSRLTGEDPPSLDTPITTTSEIKATVWDDEGDGRVPVTAAIVREIRQSVASGKSVRLISRELGLHHSTVSAIATRRRWAHVED